MSGILKRFPFHKTLDVTYNSTKIINIIKRQKYIVNRELSEFLCQTFDISEKETHRILRKNARLRSATTQHISEVIETLKVFDIDQQSVIDNPAVLIPRPASLREHGRVLLECGFRKIIPEYLIAYFKIIKKKKVVELKKNNFLPENLDIKQQLSQCFHLWTPAIYPVDLPISDENTLFEMRIHILQKYLEFRLNMKKDRFVKAIKTYNRFRHRPLKDMERSITLAQEELKMSDSKICSCPYIICADPENTLKILYKVKNLNSIDARKALNMETVIIKKDYKELMKIKDLLKKYNLSESSHRTCLSLYLLSPGGLEARLKVIETLPECQVLSTNRRFPLLIAYKRKVLERIKNLRAFNKNCTSLQSLIGDKKAFESKLDQFGDVSVSNDILLAVFNHLQCSESSITSKNKLKNYLSRHLYWRNVPVVSIAQTISMLEERFRHNDILDNCHLVLYSQETIQNYLWPILKLKEYKENQLVKNNQNDISNSRPRNKIIEEPREIFDLIQSDCANLLNVDVTKLSDTQILSITLYFIEKSHSFLGGGIWDNGRQLNRNNA